MPTAEIPDGFALSIENLSYRYPQSKGLALNSASLSVRKGSFTVLVGPSGCGKTTLLLLARGFGQELGGSFKGSIKVFGQDISGENISRLGEKVAIVFQNPATQLHQLTVGDEVASSLIYRNFPYKEVQEKSRQQVEKFLGKSFFNKPPNELSGGQQQKVALAAALALEAPIVLLDEPLSFLDTKSATEILGMLLQLKNQGKTVVLSTHHIGMAAPLADLMVLMDKGRIVLEGTPESVLYSARFKKVLPAPLAVEVGKLLRKKALSWEQLLESVKAKAVRKPALPALKSRKPIGPVKPILEIRSLSFNYNANSKAVSDASLSLSTGEIFGLIGANGSGKTTLAKCVLGLLKPQRGKVILSGQDITGWDTSRRARKIGYVTQDPRDMFFEMNLLDEVAFGPKNFGIGEPEKRAEEMLELLGLVAMKARHPDSLSGGQKSLLGLADILVSEPEVLVLDEPEFGLDPASWKRIVSILKALKRQGHTIIVITQDLEAVLFLCDSCALMSHGKVVATGSPKSVLSDSALLKKSGLSPLGIFRILPFLSSESVESDESFIKEAAHVLKLHGMDDQ